MAFTEKYVTVAGAGAHDGTSEANAWTFAEMITAAPSAGTRVNVKSGTYSVGAYTVGTGTAAAPFVIRGYKDAIGDLDNLGRNADGTLKTTDMPDITITSTWTPGALSVLQNLDITGALSAALIGSTTIDNGVILSCRIVNTQNNASARAFQCDQLWQLINSDFECSGAAHNSVCAMEGVGYVFGCRFKGVDTDNLLEVETGQVEFCAFIGNSGATNKGCVIDAVSVNTITRVVNCTFYKCATAIEIANSVNSFFAFVANCHATDCGKFIDSLYSAANIGIITANNRTRDNTTNYTGLEQIDIGGVHSGTTGDISTDYTAAGSDDLTLISTAPGKGIGMPAYLDAGAYQRQESGSSSAAYPVVGLGTFIRGAN